MKTLTTLAVVMMAFLSISFSTPVEAGKFSDFFKGNCTQKTSQARKNCRRNEARRYEQKRNQQYRQLDSIERQFGQKYDQYKRYQLQESQYMADASDADAIVADLEIKSEIKTLTRQEQSTLTQARYKSNAAYQRASNAGLYKNRFAREMKRLEDKYRMYGGRKNVLKKSIYNVPQY